MDENKAIEELQFIRRIIEDTRKSVLYNGKDYILWGVLTIIGMLSMYIFHTAGIYFNYYLIWVVLIPVGWLYTFYNKQKLKEKHPSTYSGRVFGYVWWSFGVAMTIIGFIGTYAGAIKAMTISPLACILIGSAYMVSGKIVESKWLGNLSYAWWIGGIVLFFVTTIESFLIMALLMLFFQTIPGIIIYRKYKQNLVVKP